MEIKKKDLQMGLSNEKKLLPKFKEIFGDDLEGYLKNRLKI